MLKIFACQTYFIYSVQPLKNTGENYNALKIKEFPYNPKDDPQK